MRRGRGANEPAEGPARRPDIARALDRKQTGAEVLALLSEEHIQVLDPIIVRGMTHAAAAHELKLPEKRVTSHYLEVTARCPRLSPDLQPPSADGPRQRRRSYGEHRRIAPRTGRSAKLTGRGTAACGPTRWEPVGGRRPPILTR